jgi:glycosyltransferase involved in cell wall biosynthesis
MPKQRPHILYVAVYSTGGSIESLLTLIGGLDKTAFRATVLFYRMPDPEVCERVKRAGADVLAISRGGSAKTSEKRPIRLNMQSSVRRALGRRIEYAYASLKYALHYIRFNLPTYRAIREQLQIIEPDLVHFNNTVISDTPGIHAARACGIPAISHVRTFGELTQLSVSIARSVKVFICISTAVRDHLVKCGIDAERCVVIPNAVDLDRFDDAETAAAPIREEFGWNSTDKVFALVGRLVSWKGQEYFIRAIAKARASDSSIRGLLVGDDVETGERDQFVAAIHSLIEELNVGDAIGFTGHRTDVPNIMKAADVVVCASSKPEPFGRVIIESMAVGTPVIATDAGGVTDIIDDGKNGILVPIMNSDAMAEAMLQVTNDVEFERAIRAAGLRSVADQFTVAMHVGRISEIYQDTLGAQPK